ncbi:MAG TPA: GNAT family N-acetyltransferase [Marmoricola sp.]|nr:GNAT family N-acetyltransferase [Marmoricola sp.]
MAISVREAKSQDLEALLGLYRSLHPADPVLAPGVAERTYRQMLSMPLLTIYVLEDEMNVVATATLTVIPNLTRGAAPYALIENVVVAEERRGRGVGKQLMSGVLAAAWRAGCYKATLTTGSSDPAVHGFYESAGFSATVKTAYFARPN